MSSSISGIQINQTNLFEATAALGSDDVPVHMLHLLRFHPQAQYPTSSSFVPCTGREAYMNRYIPAIATIADKVTGSSDAVTLTFLGGPVANIVSSEFTDQKWDAVGLVSYPNFTTFREIVQGQEYKDKAEDHRLASLQAWQAYAVRDLTYKFEGGNGKERGYVA